MAGSKRVGKEGSEKMVSFRQTNESNRTLKGRANSRVSTVDVDGKSRKELTRGGKLVGNTGQTEKPNGVSDRNTVDIDPLET